ncbi:MKI67 FHA domain-interacting nucleolar phosphoprotein-like [Liolophura sinensis]|uniref:MKI67 FHA domain-interacting nucleolar phosphoprotein-like n=1 Tax=Liolophura sinensis TaxID=3198878 RepID=UPI0031580EF1
MVKHGSEKGKLLLPESVSLDEKEQADLEKQMKVIKKKKPSWSGLQPGVIYVGHIPHGFYEKEMKSFFSQFGRVQRLRIARSKKTGHIKGYGFVEFQCKEVAKIVADTMNNYLMFERLLKCEYLPQDKVHPDTFKGSNRPFSMPKSHLLAIERHNRVKSDDVEKKNQLSFVQKYEKKMARLAKLGIDYKLESLENSDVMKAYNKRKSEQDENASDTESAKKRKLSKKTDESNMADTSDKYVLVEDSDEEDIVFRTPPQTVKSTILSSSNTTAKKKKISQSVGKTFTELIKDECLLSPITLVKAKGERKSLPSNRTRTPSAHKRNRKETRSANLHRRAETAKTKRMQVQSPEIGEGKNTPRRTVSTGSKAKVQRKAQRKSL